MSLFCLLKKRFENKFALFASIFEHFDLFVLVWAECFLIIREDYLIRIQVLECSGLGISRRKKDSKKICTRPRKHARVHAKKNSFKKTRTRTRKRRRKKELGQKKGSIKLIDVKIELNGKKTTNANCLFFGYFWTLSWTSACFLGRVLFSVDALFVECVFS